ncbi:helix-turn-helix transcriptional regulator [Alishewanella jeotgali]|uniref:Phage transcriptional regulator, AlpA n=1 Tax=Alishewanella jeotgali KCTC 22429 TaxID=1129374 RepID=H3ZCC5_9ALTE|nr:AlpA family phage regulatory protein [Alishewanella jeotgali]EHR41717.1 Phage transcriptional regulator, AlpA [Alishewanella jeotgali KCTC 22429]
MNTETTKPRLIARAEVIKRVSLCKASIYKRMKVGEFPKPINIGGRRVAWLESDIENWITERLALAGRAA